MFTARYGLSLYIIQFNFGLERNCISPGSVCFSLFVGNILGSKSSRLIPLKPSGYYTNSTFCPHSVFMCFVWIWEQTAIISLHNIN